MKKTTETNTNKSKAPAEKDLRTRISRLIVRAMRDQNLDTEDASTLVDCGFSLMSSFIDFGRRCQEHELKVLQLQALIKTKTGTLSKVPDSDFPTQPPAPSSPEKAKKSKRKKKGRKK